ncbi:DUF5753 domain-containing protein [Kitasatospora sp. NPDC092039]|uniref:DUF5753 domain-containing protein n=1 Tax=Kitasatospora sp. NPDC092039 TaxID=3364086 RepID=UPI00381FF1AD
MHAHWPPMDDETVEERVAARLQRQELLKTQTKSFNFLIEEHVLRRPIGSIDEQRRQLLHLLASGKPRHIAVQVVPDTGAHPGLNGPFVLLETPEHDRLAYEEGQSMGLLSSEPDKVNQLCQRHEMILRKALTPEASAEFISKLAEEL